MRRKKWGREKRNGRLVGLKQANEGDKECFTNGILHVIGIRR